jgi:hypothetical protein
VPKFAASTFSSCSYSVNPGAAICNDGKKLLQIVSIVSSMCRSYLFVLVQIMGTVRKARTTTDPPANQLPLDISLPRSIKPCIIFDRNIIMTEPRTVSANPTTVQLASSLVQVRIAVKTFPPDTTTRSPNLACIIIVL